MVSITKKVLGLASVATAFAGMAFGQATCAASATTNIIRAEGTTELVAPLTITCSVAGAVTSAAGTASLQVFLSPALPVTSKVLSTTSGNTEAIAVVSGSATQYNATVSGSTINIGSIALPALLAPGSFTITVSNVRVNATSLSVGSGVPPSISATAFISCSAGSIVPAALASTQVAFAQNGLAATKVFNTFTTATSADFIGAAITPAGFPNGAATTAGANNFVICNVYSPGNNTPATPVATVGTINGRSAGLAFVVQVNENFASAFKNAAGEASNVVTTLASNAVVAGTRLSVNFTNVPTGTTVYVPNGKILAISTQLAANAAPIVAPAAIQYTASNTTTAFATSAGSTSSSIATGSGLTSGNGLIAVAITGGAGTATFEVTFADANALDTFNIPVFVVTAANGVTASSTPISASVSFNPAGSTVIPNFVVA